MQIAARQAWPGFGCSGRCGANQMTVQCAGLYMASSSMHKASMARLYWQLERQQVTWLWQ